MATIHENYPHGLKDKVIEDSIKEYSQEISASRGNINTTMVFTPLIQLGQSELQSRQTTRATILTVIVSFTSLLISGAALYVASESSKTSAHWENSQLESLNNINKEIRAITPNINESLNHISTNTKENINNATSALVETIKQQQTTAANKQLQRTP